MLEVILIRHGESTGNQENRWQGTAEYPLSPGGIQEAERTAARLAGWRVDALYSSPLGRARQTAEIIAPAVGQRPCLDERLQEYDIGDLAGLSVPEIRQQYPAVHEAMTRPGARYLAMPGEEGAVPFRRRIVAAWQEITQAVSAGRVVVVTHRAVIMGLLAHLVGLTPEQRSPFRLYNGSISVVELGPRRAVIRRLNDTCHLRVQSPKSSHRDPSPAGSG